MNSRSIASLALATPVLVGLLACGAAQPAPVAPVASQAPVASAESGPPPEAYSPYADPGFLTLQNEKNPYVRRALCLLWVESAKADPPGASRDARQKQATQALSDAEALVATQGDPCKAGVPAALERLTADKGRLERTYLVVSEAEGENSPNATLLDAQVHVLRDAMDELATLAKPCPAQMFPDSDYQPQ